MRPSPTCRSLTFCRLIGLLICCWGNSATADLALLQIPDKPAPGTTPSEKVPQCRVTLKLTETQAGQSRIVPGMLRIRDSWGNPIPLPGLLARGTGVNSSPESEQAGIHSWSVVPGEVQISVPQARLTFEAFSGLETELSRSEIDLTGKTTQNIALALKRFANLSPEYKTANTHLHLMKLNRQECDRYLNQIPAADRLDLVFVSYLERAIADKTYISNRYTKTDLQDLSRTAGVQFGWGEEHRHNSSGFDEGYGHVMLLEIQRLIQPVSIGPGIMKQGTDGIPLSRGIQTALADQATVIWCHNAWGLESTPNFLQGRVHALNIFDGGTRSTYEDSYYPYLNAGCRVPFSTGTDWFQYDFSRVYARLQKPLTTTTWLESLRAGRTFITNGPLLDLHVDGKSIGDQIELTPEQNSVRVQATGRGRIDFQRLELIHNGTVIKVQNTKPVQNHFEAQIDFTLETTEPGWIAVRTPSPSVPKDPQRQRQTPFNEYGRELFSHTSPVYLKWKGQSRFDLDQARAYLTEMQQNREKIASQFLFADPQERAAVLDVYSDAIEDLQSKLKSR
ncbi:hypothetical protein Pan153_28310 [Gimesia panareensis]|uniref:Uncharacterized protein n=1 Tax=Gimesia panareensis TaxID=2527978 RepID=A0A518FP98_9PLAN|nr:CehA/McbA family metallohydrolase [Gimesia panareensis]QDV18174.1 hypothetical protein Pan153_28310 [Gimesia panareensis]